ncbi:LysM peptidoglycan-binding domain-containing protein [Gorillibacterium timonense]|uniref:LysM peptidoglycan-binding domain-containing protein n=1 Tax=Gorillibacterium timonense TaxID=1689269 RepID=UPI00071E0AEA|nr:LysM peptidoglycan-binding domain-containing protein [Gorillibacterium timonense]
MSSYYYCEPAAPRTSGREITVVLRPRTKDRQTGIMSSSSLHPSRTFVLALLITLSLFSGFLVTAYATSDLPASKNSTGSTSVAAALLANDTASGLQIIDVAPGDSLWSIAKEYSKGRTIPSYMRELIELNDLASSELQVGQLLVLPDEK